MDALERRLRDGLRAEGWQLRPTISSRRELEQKSRIRSRRRAGILTLAVVTGAIILVTYSALHSFSGSTAPPPVAMPDPLITQSQTTLALDSSCRTEQREAKVVPEQVNDNLAQLREQVDTIVQNNHDLFLGAATSADDVGLILVLDPMAGSGPALLRAKKVLGALAGNELLRLEVGCRSYSELDNARAEITTEVQRWNPSELPYAVSIDPLASRVRLVLPVGTDREQRLLDEMWPGLVYVEVREGIGRLN